ncbi:MAG: hypothetical protein ACLFPY_10215 [Desulfonatronovibrio sp.]
MFNLPNCLTFARIGSIPIIVLLLYFPGNITSALAMLVFIAIFQVVALCPLILHYPWWGIDLNMAGQVLIHIALVLALVSGANYLRNFYAQLQDK